MVSQTPGEYLDRAVECERLAALAANAEVRKTLHYLAQRWRDFAATAVAQGVTGDNDAERRAEAQCLC